MKQTIHELQSVVLDHYRRHARSLPWRQPKPDGSFDPYKIIVSEVMLQQTQAVRVVPKYHSFLQKFPDTESLAAAPLAAVLTEWSGLGYNRRAKYLHDAAKQLVSQPVPWSLQALTACKGIGYNTAAAVVVYTYNRPVAFIETNIRTVFIHHFFGDQTGVPDKDILPLVEQALTQQTDYRTWYWALMDYGVFLKRTAGNSSRASKHYAKQSTFSGSKRQVRGQVLKLLRENECTRQDLVHEIVDERLETVVAELLREGLVSVHGDRLRLGS